MVARKRKMLAFSIGSKTSRRIPSNMANPVNLRHTIIILIVQPQLPSSSPLCFYFVLLPSPCLIFFGDNWHQFAVYTIKRSRRKMIKLVESKFKLFCRLENHSPNGNPRCYLVATAGYDLGEISFHINLITYRFLLCFRSIRAERGRRPVRGLQQAHLR